MHAASACLIIFFKITKPNTEGGGQKKNPRHQMQRDTGELKLHLMIKIMKIKQYMVQGLKVGQKYLFYQATTTG